MTNVKNKKYKVYYTNHSTVVVLAVNTHGARVKAWKEIERHYQYGWTKSDFMKRVKVVRIVE